MNPVLCRLVQLRWAERCARSTALFGYRWLHVRFYRSRSFKVINVFTNWKPIYDFLLVISCDLSSILHRFRDSAAKEVEDIPLYFEPPYPNRGDPPSNCNVLLKVTLRTKKNNTDVKATGYSYSFFSCIHFLEPPTSSGLPPTLHCGCPGRVIHHKS